MPLSHHFLGSLSCTFLSPFYQMKQRQLFLLFKLKRTQILPRKSADGILRVFRCGQCRCERAGEQVVSVISMVAVGAEVQLMVHLHFWLRLSSRKTLLTLGSHCTCELAGELGQQQGSFFLVLELVFTPHLSVGRAVAAPFLRGGGSTLKTSSVPFRTFCTRRRCALCLRGALKSMRGSESVNSMRREPLGAQLRLPDTSSQRTRSPPALRTQSLNSTCVPSLTVTGVGVTHSGYDLSSVSSSNPNAGFQPPSCERLPQMQTFSPKLVSQVAANSRLRLVMHKCVLSIQWHRRTFLLTKLSSNSHHSLKTYNFNNLAKH